MESKDPAKEGKNPLLFLLVLINTGFIGFIFYQQSQLGREVDTLTKKSSYSTDTTKLLPHIPKPSDGHVISTHEFGDFSVNLARPNGPQRFIKLSLTFIVETPTNNKLKEILNKSSDLRDEIITILNKLTPRDVLKREGREVLKNILKDHINGRLKDDKVRRILFTRFTVS